MSEQSNPNYWRKKLEATRSKQVDACPKRARGAMKALHEAQDPYSDALMQRFHLERLIAQHEVDPAPDIPSLEQLQHDLEKAIQEVEGAGAVVAQAYAYLQSEIDDARIERVPANLRHEARALLGQEREVVRAAEEAASFSAGEYGAAGGEFFGLDGRMSQAINDGDAALVERLRPQLEAARAKKEKVEAEANEIRAQIERIKAEYDQRIAALGNG